MLQAADHGSKRCIPALFCSLLPQASPIRSPSFTLRSRMVRPHLRSTQLPQSGVGIFCPSQTKFFSLLSVCGSIPQFPVFTIKITWPKHYWTKPRKVHSWRLQAFESKHVEYAAPATWFIQKCSTLNTAESFFREDQNVSIGREMEMPT